MAERSLIDVLNQILAVVPADGYDELRRRLGRIQSSAQYTAPEVMSMRWRDAACVLAEELGVPDVDWKRSIQQIFSGSAQ